VVTKERRDGAQLDLLCSNCQGVGLLERELLLLWPKFLSGGRVGVGLWRSGETDHSREDEDDYSEELWWCLSAVTLG
jgi:hypothetical protein